MTMFEKMTGTQTLQVLQLLIYTSGFCIFFFCVCRSVVECFRISKRPLSPEKKCDGGCQKKEPPNRGSGKMD